MYIYEIYHVVLHADFMYFYVLCQKWRIKHVQPTNVKLLSSDRKLAFTSISGSDWHTNKQKVYNWPSNKSDLRPHHDRLASSRPSHAIRNMSA